MIKPRIKLTSRSLKESEPRRQPSLTGFFTYWLCPRPGRRRGPDRDGWPIPDIEDATAMRREFFR